MYKEEDSGINQRTNKNNGSQRRLGAFLCGFLCCAVLSGILWIVMTRYTGKEAAIRNIIKTEYLEDVSDDQIEEGKYRGMIDALGDKYSAYFTKEEYAETQQKNRGTYTGIGIVFSTFEDGSVFISDVYPGSPAERAELAPGDEVLEMDGISPPDLVITEVAERIRSGELKEVAIAVLRRSEEKPDGEEIRVTLVPEEVNLRTVGYEMKEDGTGYIRITNFRETTTDQFREAYEELMTGGAERIIFDLRGNGGGLVSSVTEILDVFMPEGLLVYTEEKDGKRKDYKAKGKDPIALPCAVLVNAGTASSAEIFAGAVKDRGVGIIVGETTFGKGIVQSFIPLFDNSAVKLTTANYYTPNGTNLNGTGITPDLEIALPEGGYADTGETDTQYQAAREALDRS